ncbi:MULTISPECIES: ZmpA/ZmpB/ZmpC family metallo-endopeptidase, partial [unclassified Streptococcus]|uniref:ZmpA/ZmpB/ZmpC family metallo-endopeptidase n=1 Tax=unclassified Streptococcus TaxID=2608887 RepID=UPI0011021318
EGRAGLETSTTRYSVDASTGQITALPVEVETRPAEDRVIAVGTKEIEPPEVTPEPEDVLETRQEPIAFETVYESDESLAYGSSQVSQEGVAGTKEVVWNVTKDSLVSESVTTSAVSQIVRVGTQPSVTTKELPFKEIRQDDPNLEKGQEGVVTEGRAGLETSTTRYSVDASTGQITALPVEVETRPAEDRVIAVGTKEIEPPEVTPEPEDVLETRQEPIAFETVYESDESLAYGSSQVSQEGVAGTKEVVWNVTKDSLVSESVTTPAVSQIVRVGTQPSVTTKELPFKEVRQDDPNLEKGQERVVTEGRAGLETSTTRYSVDAKTGQVTALPVEVETRPAEDRVIAVGTKEDVLETRQESIAFETVYESDESLAYGSSQVSQEGVAGTKELVWNVTKDSLVSESVTSPAVSQIVRVGTQPSVTTKELPFKEIRQDDPNLEKGQERVVTEGRAGLETSTTRYSVDAKTGQVTALPVEVETRPAEDRVIAVGTKEDVLETRQESIAFETVYESDESLAYGSSQVSQEGVAGTKELVWNVTKDSLVSESVTSPAVSRIVRVGTQPSVTTKELPFKEVRQDDPNLEKGQERIVTEGRAGLETSTTRYSVDAKTGQVTALPVEVETRPAEDRVIAVGTKEDVLETRQEPIAFETVYESDESLAYGSTQIAQEGVVGTKEIVWNVTKDRLVSERIAQPAVSRIIRVGTQPSVTTKELPFKEVRQDDPNLEKGQERVVTEGRTGLETSTTRYSVDASTGQVTALPTQIQITPAIDHVVAVGTKEPVKPSLRIQNLEKDVDQKRVVVTYQLVDPDARYQSAKVLLYKGNELIRELVLSDPKQPVILSDLDYFTDYTLRTEMTYSLSGQAVTESQAKQEDFVLEYKKIELKDIQGIEIYEKVDGNFRKVENFTTLKSADTYFVNVRSKDSKDMLLPVSAIDEVEKDGKAVYRYTVSFPELVQEGQNGYKNDLALYIPKDGSNPSVVNAYRANYLALPDAKADREIAYYNTEKLLPFYSKDYLVYMGNKIDPSHKLYQTKLVDVVPMVDNRIVTDVYTDKTAVNRLMLHYEDNSVAYVPVTYKEDFKNNQLAEYSLTGTPLLYTPENFLTSYQSVIDEVLPVLSAINFDSKEIRDALGIQEGETGKNIGDLYLEQGFNNLKANLSQELRKLLASDKAINSGDGIIREKLVSDLKNNAVPLLLGLSYLNRWYDINYGEINVKDLSVYKSDFFGKQDVSILEQVIALGNAGFDKLKAANNVTTFASHLSPAKQKGDLFSYLESYRALFLPNKSNNEWLKENTKAYLVESFSGIPEHRERQEAAYGQRNNKYSIGIYDRMTSRSNVWKYQHMILPLLTMKEESVYIISNMSNLMFGGYERYRTGDLAALSGEDYNKAIRSLVDQAGIWYRDYFDFWYKMLTEKSRERMFGPLVAYDGFLYYSPDGSRSWRNLYDKDASIQEFFGPAGRYYLNSGAGAFANGISVSFIFYRFLDRSGAGILTHEMTHNFDDNVYLEGNRGREGSGAEHYAQGLLESPAAPDRAVLGINMLFQFDEEATDRYHTANPVERYKTPEDLQEYMKGMFDVLYLLEYVEAQAVLSQSTEVKKAWWRKLENEWTVDRDGNQTHAANKIRRLTDEEASQLQTFTDLIDRDIMNRRYYRDEETLRRGTYYGVPLLSPIYSAITNDKGMPGDLTFRRTAFELIAAKGYQEGFVPYTSNMYAQEALSQGLKTWSDARRNYVGLPNDQLIFEKIFKGEYATWSDFKKAMYQERLDKARNQGLKPITIQYELGRPNSTETVTISSLDELQELMNAALQRDMTNIDRATSHPPASWVNALLSKVYNAYLRQSKDFRESIFK